MTEKIPPQNELRGPILDIYDPSEAAYALNISTATLAGLRRKGKIAGTRKGTTTVYTKQQLLEADLSRDKPGPKAGEGSRVGRAKYTWPTAQKEHEGGTLDEKSSRWRTSRNQRNVRHLVEA